MGRMYDSARIVGPNDDLEWKRLIAEQDRQLDTELRQLAALQRKRRKIVKRLRKSATFRRRVKRKSKVTIRK